MSGTSVFDDAVDRFIEGIALSAIVIVYHEMGAVMGQTTEAQSHGSELIILGLSNAGLIVGIVGLIVVLWRAGLIGLIGYMMELVATANFSEGVFHVELYALGVFIIVFGSVIWRWSTFFEIMSSSSGGRP